MSLSRISITIPEELVQAADRRAEDLDRSRSWVLVEALRRYLRADDRNVREATPTYGLASGLTENRLAQLRSDLELTPTERVEAAEEVALVAELRGRPPLQDRVISFDTLQDFRTWELLDGLDP